MNLRIALISPRPVGLLGTPGHYKYFQEMARHAQVRVFAPAPSALSVWWDPRLPLIPIEEPEDCIAERMDASSWRTLIQFDPHVVYIFAHRHWYHLASAVHERLPKAKILLDIKTGPLIRDLSSREEDIVHGSKVLALVDQVLSLSPVAIGAYYRGEARSTNIIRLGVDVVGIQAAIERRSRQPMCSASPWNVCYVASLSPRRQALVMLSGFADFLASNRNRVHLHVFGDGPDRVRLEGHTRELGIADAVSFHGKLAQDDLYKALGQMDGAIAWVPQETYYDDQPSLKSLEYAAAGLPVLATATRAHLAMQQEGFSFDYCDDTAPSLAAGLAKWATQGFSHDRVLQNLEAVRTHDYARVVQDEILPVLTELATTRQQQEGNRAVAYSTTGPEVTPEGHVGRVMRVLVLVPELGEGHICAGQEPEVVANALPTRGHLVYFASHAARLGRSSEEFARVDVPFDDPRDLSRLLRDGRIDVLLLYAVNDTSAAPYVRLAATHEVPLVVHYAGEADPFRLDRFEGVELSRAHSRWERELLLANSALLICDRTSQDQVSGYLQPNLRPCPDASHRRTTPTNQKKPIDGRWRIVATIGEDDNSGLEDLLGAFLQLAPRFPDWDMNVVSTRAAQANRPLEQLLSVVPAELMHRVTAQGTSEDALPDFSRAHIHVAVAQGADAHSSVLAAQERGVPSIGFTDDPRIGKTIEHGRTGLIVDRVAGLASALNQLMGDSDWRTQLASGAMHEAPADAMSTVTDLWETLLDEATQGDKRPGDRHVAEQEFVDRELALHARRMRVRLHEMGL